MQRTCKRQPLWCYGRQTDFAAAQKWSAITLAFFWGIGYTEICPRLGAGKRAGEKTQKKERRSIPNSIVVLGFENQYGTEAMLGDVHKWQEEYPNRSTRKGRK